MAKPRGLLQRLLNTPDLAAIVPRLEPEVLRRVIQACGLEDCADFVALATPEQLARVLDSDVWRTRVAGADEEFDPERFGVWLTVLMEAGAAVAAEKLAGLEIELVIAGLAHHVAVIDYVAAAAYTTLDGERVPGRTRRADLVSELGGYVIEARRTSAWEPIVELFTFLASERPEYFHRVMRECVRLSDGAREEDGFHDLLDDREQDMFDLAAGREADREERGYVAAAQARAFLHEARAVRLDADRPSPSAIVRAYCRAIQPAVAAKSDAPAEPDVSAIFELLEQAEPLSSRPRALLGAADGQPAGLSFVHAHAASHPASEEELAYLANAIVAGCSVQGRPFTIREASDCAVRACNLGLENWPRHWSERDLITAFKAGWTILHRDVCQYATEQLIDVLAAVRCSDRDVQLRLDGLRRKLIQHRGNRDPWHVGDALDAILILDAPCWAALRGLIDECPVIHAALRASRQGCRTINPADFEFISENTQIAAVREFLTALPTILAG